MIKGLSKSSYTFITTDTNLIPSHTAHVAFCFYINIKHLYDPETSRETLKASSFTNRFNTYQSLLETSISQKQVILATCPQLPSVMFKAWQKLICCTQILLFCIQ